jgi:menaquinone-dependent protoporphyrinogen oxidase
MTSKSSQANAPSRVLLLYGTSDGHTEDVVKVLCEALADGLPATSIHCQAIENAPLGLTGHHAVVLGSSIHLGQHHREVVDWAALHRDFLSSVPSAFFQVSLSSADPAHESDARSYVDHLVEQTGWHPDLVGLFGGALLYTRYGFAKKRLIKSIAKKGGLGTDTHRDYDYTDYDAVRHFGSDIATLVASRGGT